MRDEVEGGEGLQDRHVLYSAWTFNRNSSNLEPADRDKAIPQHFITTLAREMPLPSGGLEHPITV